MKILKYLLIAVAVLAALFFLFGWPYLQEQTKKISPEKTATYQKNGMDLSVNYSSPFKKNRIIFGELVPYDKIWRTGANEPTTFTTTTDINIIDKKLPAGTYSLWTKPKKESWQVIFNKEVPGWGVSMFSGGAKTSRDPEQDALQVELATESLSTTQESFTIDFEENNQLYLIFSWDQTKVKVPINK